MGGVRSPKDLISGLMFIVIGIGAIAIASNYTLGTAARMGPGYFPRILGILMIALGAILALRSLRLRGEPRGAGGGLQAAERALEHGVAE